MILVAKPAGQTPPKVEKFAQEIIKYTIDCTALLDKFELITQASIIDQNGILYSGIRTRKGVSVEVSITNDPIRTAAYLDFTIPIKLDTSLGNSRVAVLQLRVYK